MPGAPIHWCQESSCLPSTSHCSSPQQVLSESSPLRYLLSIISQPGLPHLCQEGRHAYVSSSHPMGWGPGTSPLPQVPAAAHPSTDEDEVLALGPLLLFLKHNAQLVLDTLGLDELADWETGREDRSPGPAPHRLRTLPTKLTCPSGPNPQAHCGHA